MSVLIKGMALPKNCDICPLITEADDYHVCYINEQFIPWEWVDEHSAEQRHPKPSWCPLIEIPPHGRLIDADAPISLVDTHGKNIEVTVAHIIENNLGIVNAIIESEASR